jgi:Tfp pilus assembly protein FimT
MYNNGNSSKNVTGSSIVDGAVETVDIADDAVTADKLANSVNTDIGTGVTASTTAGDALPKAGGTMTGTIAGFTSTGIDDNATSTQQTITDGAIGHGEVPKVWHSTFEATQFGQGGFSTGRNQSYEYNTGSNAYLNAAGTWTHLKSGYAAIAQYNLGAYKFKTSSYAAAGGAAALTTRFEIGNTGDVTVNTGNLVIGTSGKGIMFSPFDETVSTPGSDSNLLDDYEEGTYTPEVRSHAGTDPVVTYTTQTGYYTKIGNIVTLNFYIKVATTNGGGAYIGITQPFVMIGNPTGTIAGALMNTGGASPDIYGDIGSSRMGIMVSNYTGGGKAWLWNTALAANSEIWGQITFRV